MIHMNRSRAGSIWQPKLASLLVCCSSRWSAVHCLAQGHPQPSNRARGLPTMGCQSTSAQQPPQPEAASSEPSGALLYRLLSCLLSLFEAHRKISRKHIGKTRFFMWGSCPMRCTPRARSETRPSRGHPFFPGIRSLFLTGVPTLRKLLRLLLRRSCEKLPVV